MSDFHTDDVTEVTFTQMVSASGLTATELTELVRYGVVVPRDPAAAPMTFEARWVFTARTASRLRRELDLDAYGVSVAMGFLERIEALEAELRALRARLG